MAAVSYMNLIESFAPSSKYSHGFMSNESQDSPWARFASSDSTSGSSSSVTVIVKLHGSDWRKCM